MDNILERIKQKIQNNNFAISFECNSPFVKSIHSFGCAILKTGDEAKEYIVITGIDNNVLFQSDGCVDEQSRKKEIEKLEVLINELK